MYIKHKKAEQRVILWHDQSAIPAQDMANFSKK